MHRITPLLLAVALIVPTVAIADNTSSRPVTHDPAATAHQRLHEHKGEAAGSFGGHVPQERLSDVACEDGQAGPFKCDGIDLLSFVPYDEFVGLEFDPLGGGISDVWGWTDEENGDEYVIIGASNGVEFFRVTDPTDPVHLGSLENTAAAQLIWHDTKVFKDHAFVVSESNPHGMRIFDLTRLRGVGQAQIWTEDARYPLPVAAHNVELNTETGFAYIVGGNAGIVVPDHCGSGLHMVDVNEPQAPVFAGCLLEEDVGIAGNPLRQTVYTHDAQCVVYRGPDQDYQGREICVNSNEDHVAIADVTDKSDPQVIGRTSYPHVGYTHQGWLTEDHAHFILGDELDERDRPQVQNTRNVLFDVTDLENPEFIGEHFFDTRSITHNIYTKDGLAYHSNYASGLRVTDTANIADGELEEIAFFDTFPPGDFTDFLGTWSNYPYFDSGTIAVSGIDEGLFLLRLQDDLRPETPGDETRLERLEVTDADGQLEVSGRALFRGDSEQVGFHDAGTAAAPGADLTGAHIAALDQNLLEFTIDVANMPPVTHGTPEAVQYNWELTATSDGESSTFMLSALRSAQGQRPGSAAPAFALYTCQEPAGAEPGQCFAETELVGQFTEDGVRFIVPAAAIKASGGAEIAQGPRTLRTVLSAAGGGWFVNPAPVLSDEMPLGDFAFPAPTVEVGVGSVDVPVEDVQLAPAELDGATGRFDAALDLPEEPGAYQVVTRACFGDDRCATDVQVIEVQ